MLDGRIVSSVLMFLLMTSTGVTLRLCQLRSATLAMVSNDLELRVTIEDTVIVIGEEVNVTLTVRNVGTSNVTLVFSTCQKFDVAIFNESFICSWSEGKYFCMLYTEILLRPGEEFSQTLQWNFYWFNRTSEQYSPPAPGCYYLVGKCMAVPTPIQEILRPSIRIYLVPETVEGWAVILEMNNFPEGWSSAPSMNFTNTKIIVDTLLELGWQNDHFYIKHDNITIEAVREAVEWLANKARFGDIALLYIFTHGSWMRKVLHWNDWFAGYWQKVSTPRRILMIDTCSAGEFIEPILTDLLPHVSLAHCLKGEVAWAGIPEEGLPIIGSVWNYYFYHALRNSTADSDGDGFVSVEEAFNFSTPLVQKYMNETVFAVPEFLEMYHEIGIYPENYDAYPHPLIDDQYPGQLYLDFRYHRLVADLNGDGIVDIIDVAIVAKAFGSKPGDKNWNAIADLDKNGIINIIDIAKVAKEFGKIA